MNPIEIDAATAQSARRWNIGAAMAAAILAGTMVVVVATSGPSGGPSAAHAPHYPRTTTAGASLTPSDRS